MNEYLRARKSARKQGIKITDKSALQGYRVSYDWTTYTYLTQLFYWDWGKWEMYDFSNFDTLTEARESGKDFTKH